MAYEDFVNFITGRSDESEAEKDMSADPYKAEASFNKTLENISKKYGDVTKWLSGRDQADIVEIENNNKLSESEKEFVIANKVAKAQQEQAQQQVQPVQPEPMAQQPVQQPMPQQQAQQQAAMGQQQQMVSMNERPGANLGTYQGIIRDARENLSNLGDYQQNIDDTYAQQQELARAQRDAEIARAEQMKVDAEAQAALSIDQQRRIQRKEEERKSITDNLMNEMVATREDLVNTKLKEESFGQKLSLSIAAALVAFGSTLSGGDPTAGLKMIQNHLDQRQRKLMNLKAGKKEKLNALNEEYNKYRDIFGSERAAEAAVNASEWNTVEKELMANQAKYAGTAAEQAYQQTLAGVAQKKAEAENRLRQYSEELILKAQKQADDVEYRKQAMGMERVKLAAAMSAGKPRKQIGEKQAVDIADMKAMQQQVLETKDKFLELTGPGSFIAQYIPGTDASEYDRYVDLLRDAFARARTGAVINQSEQKAFERMIPTPSTFKSKGIKAFDALNREFGLKINNRLKALEEAGYDTGAISKVGSSFR